jgi:hypothetical protein
MSNFAIMRCSKLSSMASLSASLSHCFRERDTPNADPTLTPRNIIFSGARTGLDVLTAFKEKLPEKRRKDAVIAVEYLMTASPEFFHGKTPTQQEKFFDDALEWLRGKYGSDRVLCAVVHHDETSPHLSAFVVPITKDNRLCAKEFIGDRASMTADQTSFHQAVKHHGLERGVERSRAKHTTIQQFYAGLAVEEPRIDVRIPEADVFEKKAVYGQRVAEVVTHSAKRTISALEAQLTHEKTLRQKAERRANEAESDLKRVKPLLNEVLKMGWNREQDFIRDAVKLANDSHRDYQAMLALEKSQKAMKKGLGR